MPHTFSGLEPRSRTTTKAGTPPKSRAEMEALAALPNVEAAVLPAGKLAVHEEFPDAVADAIKSFLSR